MNRQFTEQHIQVTKYENTPKFINGEKRLIKMIVNILYVQ